MQQTTVTGELTHENGARRGHRRRQRSHQTAENENSQFSITLGIRLTPTTRCSMVWGARNLSGWVSAAPSIPY